MNAKLTGYITDIFPTETFQSGFAKRVFWLKQPDTERYPEHWKVELHRADVDQLNRFQVGDLVTAEVEVRGKKWERNNQQDIVLSLKCVGLELKERLAPAPPKIPFR